MKVYPIDDLDTNYDLGLFGLGYEARGITCFNAHSGRTSHSVAIGYQRQTQRLNYQSSKASFLAGGAEVLEPDDEGGDADGQLAESILNRLRTVQLDTGGPLSVLMDISVMTRSRLACILWLCITNPGLVRKVHIYYTQARYEEPDFDTLPIRKLGPIFENMVSFSGHLALPLLLVTAVGYEPDKAFGVVSDIDPDENLVLLPVSADSRYNEKVRQNNALLLETVNPDSKLSYRVDRPFSSYYDLKAVVASKLETRRVSMLPIGPKINACVCVLLAKEFYPRVTVWRASSLERTIGHDRVPSDYPPVLLGVDCN